MTPWDYPDFDHHEGVHLFRNPASGLTAIIAIHSSALGPAGGGVRYWQYPSREQAITDALRLSRGMSYKNAMAELPAGGGKGVILADPAIGKTPELLAAFGDAIESLGGRYVTAEDVGITAADMTVIRRHTSYVSGLPIVDEGAAGGDPGPSTALGVFLGIKAATRRALGRESMAGVHVAIQGVGSVGGGVARLLAGEGAKLTLADVNIARAEVLAAELGGVAVPADTILGVDADILSPCALGAVLSETTIPLLKVPVVAGGANNQLATSEDAARLHARGILYAPDYVINAGGIINVTVEYRRLGDRRDVLDSIHRIPARLESIWAESVAGGEPAAVVADRMARKLIGRG